MPTDNTQLNAGSGGNTLRTLADSNSVEWPVAVLCYATTVSPGANVLDVVTPSAGLPVAQQGTWTVTANAGTGTFAVSAASLPLPSGAATSAKQPAIGTAGTASADVLTVQGIASMTAIKVDGSAVTQPVSGTVTADQGGTWTVNVAASQTIAVTQATAASLNATVVGTGTFAVQASQAGTWNVGTVTAVTGITNALPSGTNLLGRVAAGDQVASLFNGTTAVTPQYAPITASASGATTIVAGVAGKRIYILRWSLSANGNVNVNWQSHTTISTATGLHYMTLYATAGGAYCPAGIFATAVGEALDLNLSASIAVGGELTYVVF